MLFFLFPLFEVTAGFLLLSDKLSLSFIFVPLPKISHKSTEASLWRVLIPVLASAGNGPSSFGSSVSEPSSCWRNVDRPSMSWLVFGGDHVTGEQVLLCHARERWIGTDEGAGKTWGFEGSDLGWMLIVDCILVKHGHVSHCKRWMKCYLHPTYLDLKTPEML